MIIIRQKFFTDKDSLAVGGTILGTGGVIAGGSVFNNKYNNYIKKDTPIQEDYSKIKVDVGDIVSAERSGGVYKHYGVITGFDELGNPIVTNYTLERAMDPRKSSVVESSLKDFGEGGKVLVEKNNGKYTPKEIQQRAKELVNSGFGDYSVSKNNCEHFARYLANGDKISDQVNSALNKYEGVRKIKSIYEGLGGLFDKSINTAQRANGRVETILEDIGNRISRSDVTYNNIIKNLERRFSEPINAIDLIKEQGKRLLSGRGAFEARKGLTKELGGISHFNKYQTSYLTLGGAASGGTIGSIGSKEKAEKDAEKYGLKKGTLEYDEFIKRRRRDSIKKGALIGAGTGFISSKGIDTIRGKVIADKALYGKNKLDLGKNYMGLGRTMRGVKSEEDIENVVKNWKEVSSYLKGIKDAL